MEFRRASGVARMPHLRPLDSSTNTAVPRLGLEYGADSGHPSSAAGGIVDSDISDAAVRASRVDGRSSPYPSSSD